MSSLHDWLEPLLALGAIVMPLVMAWWWVAHGARTRPRRKRRARDNAAHRRDIP